MIHHKILAVGEVLFDVIEGDYKLGGAPFNVAAHLAKLGHHSYILSGVGNDALGDRIIEEAERLNVSTELIHRHPTAPTGTVQVTFEAGEPQYEIVENVAWDYLAADFDEVQRHQWEVVAFGSLAQRSAHNRSFFDELFRNLTSRWRYFDCNLRQDYYDKDILERSLRLANISKFNEHELGVCSELLYGQQMVPENFAARIHADFGIEAVIYTWGKTGSRAWYRGKLYFCPSKPVTVADTIGAGDAFNAGFLHSWINGGTVEEALELGNQLGAFVASKSGAIPEYDDEIRGVESLGLSPD